MRRARKGIALVLALMVLVVVEVLTAGIIALASQARGVADSQLRATRAQNAADYDVASIVNSWQSGRFDTIPIGQTANVLVGAKDADAKSSVSVERLAAATYIVRAIVTVGGSLAYNVARSTAIARTLDRAALIAESNSAISSGGSLVIAGATAVTASTATLPPAWPDSVCPATDPLPPPNALTTATAPVIGADAAIAGPVSVDTTLLARDSVALGGVKWSELASIADRIERGSITPAPADSAGTCAIHAPGNWGDPARADAACASWFPLIFSNGDLTVSGGSGQGILAVAGTLTITGGTVFTGLIVARDGLSIEPGAKVYGAIRSRSGYALLESALASYSRCAVARGALATPSSGRVILSQRRFIPSF